MNEAPAQTLRPSAIDVFELTKRFGELTAVDRATFTVTSDGALVARMHPEKRHFIVERSETTDAAIHPTIGGDLYVVIGDKGADHVLRVIGGNNATHAA